MARLVLVLIPLFASLLLATITTDTEAYSITTKARYPGDNPKKLTHLHFYLHDIVSGNKPTAIPVTRPASRNSTALFGMVVVADDKLTLGPESTSLEVGRAQGVYAAADQKTIALLMNLNLVFTAGEFSGSTLSMYGRNEALSKVREMPIVGGTGGFRFGRGYAQASTFSFNLTSGNAVVEYNVYVWH